MLFCPVSRNVRAAAERALNRRQLAEAGAQKSFWLLIAGYFTCGFQLQFITLVKTCPLTRSSSGQFARLAELDLLRHVEVLSCVSGGSIIGAHYYLEVRKLLQSKRDHEITRDDYVEVVRRMADDFLRQFPPRPAAPRGAPRPLDRCL